MMEHAEVQRVMQDCMHEINEYPHPSSTIFGLQLNSSRENMYTFISDTLYRVDHQALHIIRLHFF